MSDQRVEFTGTHKGGVVKKSHTVIHVGRRGARGKRKKKRMGIAQGGGNEKTTTRKGKRSRKFLAGQESPEALGVKVLNYGKGPKKRDETGGRCSTGRGGLKRGDYASRLIQG